MKKNIIKVPLILADKNSGSGAASLAMVLSFFGINVGTDGVNGVCNTFRFGEEPDKLIFIAKGFGVESSEISPSLQDVLSLPPPAVFRMKNGEYALFRGCRNKKIYLSFPLQGEKIIPLKYFQEIFSGVCLIFKEPPGFSPDRKSGSASDFFRRSVKESPKGFVVAGVCTLLAVFLGVCFPAGLRIVFDRILTGKDPWLLGITLIMTAAGFAVSLLTVLKWSELYKFAARLSAQADFSLFSKMQNLGGTYFSMHTSCELQALLESARNMTALAAEKFMPLLFNVFAALLCLLYALLFNPLGALPAAIGFVLQIVLAVLVRLTAENRVTEDVLRQKNEKIRASETETLSETLGSNAFTHSFLKDCRNEKNSSYPAVFFKICSRGVALLSHAFTAVVAFLLILNKNETAGTALFLMFLSFFIFFRAEEIPESVLLLSRLRAQAAFIDDFLRYPIVDKTEIHDIKGNIVMDKVSFGYNEFEPPILKEVSFSAENGKRYAVVGDGGSGKTSAVKLLCGLLTPGSGDIFYGGRSVYDTRSALEKSAFYLDGNPVIFRGTLKENICMFDMSFSENEILQAAQKSGLSYTLFTFDGGLECEISEDKRRLTNGERQLIAATRLFLFKPAVAALDNAFSALPASREAQLLTRLKAQGTTVFIVTNRAEIASASDGVAYIKNGKIISRTHVEFMTSDRDYQKLFV